jgi:mono/diheme cytochrome c family protein
MAVRRALIPLIAIVCATIVAPRDVPAQSGDLVARGRYLVGAAGKCSDCHGAKLQGTRLDFLNPKLPPIFERYAPAIAGLPQLSTAAAVRFLHTGVLPNGRGANPPMPQYRFSVADATAIVAYLKSLP